MAVLKKGVYSEISGKLGGYVFSMMNGKTIVKSLPDPSTPKKAPTEAQLATRAKFKMVSGLLRPFAPVIAVGFKRQKCKMGPRCWAFKQNYQRVVIGVFPHLKIDYKELKLSSGSASGLRNLKMEDKGAALFGLSWRCCDCDHNHDDMLVLVLYEETRGVVYMLDLAKVGSEQAEFEVCDRIGCKVHVYVFTVGKSKGKNSDSQYLGLVA